MIKIVQAVCNDIECDACASAIKKSLGKLDGVQDVSVDVASKLVVVSIEAETITPDRVFAQLTVAGFTPESPTNA